MPELRELARGVLGGMGVPMDLPMPDLDQVPQLRAEIPLFSGRALGFLRGTLKRARTMPAEVPEEFRHTLAMAQELKGRGVKDALGGMKRVAEGLKQARSSRKVEAMRKSHPEMARLLSRLLGGSF